MTNKKVSKEKKVLKKNINNEELLSLKTEDLKTVFPVYWILGLRRATKHISSLFILLTQAEQLNLFE